MGFSARKHSRLAWTPVPAGFCGGLGALSPVQRCVGRLTTTASGRPCRPEDRSEKGSDLVPGGELFAPMPRIPAEDLSIVLSAARSLVAHCRLAAEGVKPALDALGDEA